MVFITESTQTVLNKHSNNVTSSIIDEVCAIHLGISSNVATVTILFQNIWFGKQKNALPPAMYVENDRQIFSRPNFTRCVYAMCFALF